MLARADCAAGLKVDWMAVQAQTGANAGFHNDTTPRYDRAAAEMAWERAIAFFSEKPG